jgi:hypothetical protein
MRETISLRTLDLEGTGIAIVFTEPGHKLVKIAFSALGGFFQVYQGKFFLLEFLEEFFPRNFFQCALLGIPGKIESEQGTKRQ